MQVCTCTVRLAGRVDQEISNKLVTVAEIQVIRSIHGADAVKDVLPANAENRSNADELERLQMTYGEKAVKAVFPGFQPMLPKTLKDIGMDPKAQAKELREKSEQMAKMAAQLEESDGETAIVVDATQRAPKTQASIFDDVAA